MNPPRRLASSIAAAGLCTPPVPRSIPCCPSVLSGQEWGRLLATRQSRWRGGEVRRLNGALIMRDVYDLLRQEGRGLTPRATGSMRTRDCQRWLLIIAAKHRPTSWAGCQPISVRVQSFRLCTLHLFNRPPFADSRGRRPSLHSRTQAHPPGACSTTGAIGGVVHQPPARREVIMPRMRRTRRCCEIAGWLGEVQRRHQVAGAHRLCQQGLDYRQTGRIGKRAEDVAHQPPPDGERGRVRVRGRLPAFHSVMTTGGGVDPNSVHGHSRAGGREKLRGAWRSGRWLHSSCTRRRDDRPRVGASYP